MNIAKCVVNSLIESKEIWSVSDTKDAKYIGTLDGGEDTFEVLSLPDRLVFGCAANGGFVESGYIKREEGETDDTLLQELSADLEVYYSDGPGYVSRIVCNERV